MRAGLDAPVFSAAKALFDQAAAQGWAELDIAAIHDLLAGPGPGPGPAPEPEAGPERSPRQAPSCSGQPPSRSQAHSKEHAG